MPCKAPPIPPKPGRNRARLRDQSKVAELRRRGSEAGIEFDPQTAHTKAKLYALDVMLDLRGATKSKIERAMQGHALANAELIGTYQKGDR